MIVNGVLDMKSSKTYEKLKRNVILLKKKLTKERENYFLKSFSSPPTDHPWTGLTTDA